MNIKEIKNQGYKIKKYFHPRGNNRFDITIFENKFENKLIEIYDHEYNSISIFNEKEMDDIGKAWRNSIESGGLK